MSYLPPGVNYPGVVRLAYPPPYMTVRPWFGVPHPQGMLHGTHTQRFTPPASPASPVPQNVIIVRDVVNNYVSKDSDYSYSNTEPLENIVPVSIDTEISEQIPLKKKVTKRKKKTSGVPGAKKGARPKLWNRQDAEKALEIEKQYRLSNNKKSIRITFPDEEINSSIVRDFHPSIKTVQFRMSCAPRHCFVLLDENADVDQTINDLNKVPFNNSFLKAELHEISGNSENSVEKIDPYQLYVGNLPANITADMIKSEFPKSTRTDVGFSFKCGATRYAFVKFSNVDDAISAYIEKLNLVFQNQTAIIRFRRMNNSYLTPSESICSRVSPIATEIPLPDEQSLPVAIKTETTSSVNVMNLTSPEKILLDQNVELKQIIPEGTTIFEERTAVELVVTEERLNLTSSGSVPLLDTQQLMFQEYKQITPEETTNFAEEVAAELQFTEEELNEVFDDGDDYPLYDEDANSDAENSNYSDGEDLLDDDYDMSSEFDFEAV